VQHVARAIRPSDLDRVIELNRGAAPAVNDIDAAEMAWLVEHSHAAIAVVADNAPDDILGFVLALRPGVDYHSENYRWFTERGTDFLYVDRIVVAEGRRSAGIGALLYDAVFAAARAAGAAEVACEVNVEPPNPGSLVFHSRLGFTEVGRQATKNGSVVVTLLVCAV
jgi:predicted GNAT superfamily acetyltransferase